MNEGKFSLKIIKLAIVCRMIRFNVHFRSRYTKEKKIVHAEKFLPANIYVSFIVFQMDKVM